jgi:hypothetical protein
LTSVSFKGNAPSFGANVFFGDDKAVFYCLPETTGWDAPIDGRPAKVWNPRIKSGDGNFGMKGKHFGFTIDGTANIPVVIESCTNLSKPAWVMVSTNILTGGSSCFRDPRETNASACFYRLRMP